MTIRNISKMADDLIEHVCKLASDAKENTPEGLKDEAKKEGPKYKETTKDNMKPSTIRNVNRTISDMPESYFRNKKAAQDLRRISTILKGLDKTANISYQDVTDYVKLISNGQQ